jgi:DNA gyrase subunit A
VRPKEEDLVQRLFVASSHDLLLFFTNQGRLYWKKVHEVPEAGRMSRGKAVVNLLDLQEGERVATTLSLRDFAQGKYIVMATRQGLVKKTELAAYANPRAGGILALKINEDDELIAVEVTDGENDLFIATREGKSVRFPEAQLRPMGRVAVGNIGIRMESGDAAVAMEALRPGATILTVTENGYGKRSREEEYRRQSRGGKGILTIKTSKRNGSVVSSCQVTDDDQVMIVTAQGKIIRIFVKDISVIGRNTQGVKLIDLGAGEKVVSLAKVIEE